MQTIMETYGFTHCFKLDANMFCNDMRLLLPGNTVAEGEPELVHTAGLIHCGEPLSDGTRAQNGGKTAFICADAGQAVWDKAEKFLE